MSGFGLADLGLLALAVVAFLRTVRNRHGR